MQQFGNLKVGSVFSFLHPETAVSVFEKKRKSVSFKKKEKKGFKKGF